MKTEESHCKVCSVVAPFVLGGLIGAAAALLAAPKAGKELRREIKSMAEGVVGKAEDYYNEVKETVTSALEHGKGLLSEKQQLIQKAVRAGVDAFEAKGAQEVEEE